MNTILQKTTSKKLFFISLAVVGYFCLLYLNGYIIKSDLFIIGVIQESLTIPLIIIQFVLLVISIFCCIKDKFHVNRYSFWSLIILLANNLFVIWSFI